MSYYDRTIHTHLDGTPIFKSAEDEKNEREVARFVGLAFNCKLHSFGCLSDVDWWAERHGRPVAILELKSRSHDSRKYPTVFLNARKWTAMMMLQHGWGQPPIFVVRFTDIILYVSLNDISGGKLRIGGCKGIVKSRNDVEPVIDVKVSEMKVLPPMQVIPKANVG